MRFVALFIFLIFNAITSVIAIAQPIQLALIESLSGPFANTGEAVLRNLAWGVERINSNNKTNKTYVLKHYDSKGQNEEALSALRLAIDDGAKIILQGNSSSTALVLMEAIQKHNERNSQQQVLFFNYAAVEPSLTQEKCSYWHFRFDAHSDMRMNALMQVIKADRALQKIYLIGQDYSFGQSVNRQARKQLGAIRPDVTIVGEELHPIGRIKDFLPYIQKIQSSGAQAVITGNWGNDLTLLVKAAKEAGFDGKFYTFYGNALGVPSAIGDAGVDKVIAVAEWMPNTPNKSAEQLYQQFLKRFTKQSEDYMHLRMQVMLEMLSSAVDQSKKTNAQSIAKGLEDQRIDLWGHKAWMRATDHQLQQPIVVGVMQKKSTDGLLYDVEGSGLGFKTILQLNSIQTEQVTTCQMQKP